jgi:DNA mismatch endonuclease, patch repair protein
MSRIKSKDTKPELTVRRFLHARGFRYALHRRDLPGTPDIVLPKYRTVVFVHGCLWHGHVPCSKYLPPRTHRDYWILKIRANRRRDARQRRMLRRLGWRVLVVWECQAREERLLSSCLRSILDHMDGKVVGSALIRLIVDRSSILSFEALSLAVRLRKYLRRSFSRVRHSAPSCAAAPSSPRAGWLIDPLAELRAE